MFAYHFIWYTIPLIIAPRYNEFTYRTEPEIYSFLMLLCTYMLGMFIFDKYCYKIRDYSIRPVAEINKMSVKTLSSLFFVLTITAGLLSAILSPVGLIGWLQDPGGSFATRDGSGVGTILLIFSSGVYLALGSYFIQKSKNKFLTGMWYFLIMAFLFVFMVGRAKLLTFTVFLFIIPFFKLKFKIKTALYIVVFTILTVGLASIVRGTFNNENQSAYEIALNYFDTYDALYRSVKSESPSLGSTSFMAFRKLFTPFGYDANEPYTLSLKLTKIYFPGWANRSTVQFPVESDMYLSWWYIGGIPLLAIYFYIIALLYNKAYNFPTLGNLYVAVSMTIYLLSHLRGMLIDWTDLYYYPILFLSYYILNNKEISQYLLKKYNYENK